MASQTTRVLHFLRKLFQLGNSILLLPNFSKLHFYLRSQFFYISSLLAFWLGDRAYRAQVNDGVRAYVSPVCIRPAGTKKLTRFNGGVLGVFLVIELKLEILSLVI